MLLMMLYAIYSAVKSFFGGRKFSKTDEKLRKYVMIFAHIQLIMGIWLYLASPMIHDFWGNFKVAVHIKAMRFFAMEHSVMMILSIAVITIGAILTKRMKTEDHKVKMQLVWLVVALAMILVSIPWEFNPWVEGRPYFRGF